MAIGGLCLIGIGYYLKERKAKAPAAAVAVVQKEVRRPRKVDHFATVTHADVLAGMQKAANLDENGLGKDGKPLPAPLPDYKIGESYTFVYRSYYNEDGRFVSAIRRRWTIVDIQGEDLTWRSNDGVENHTPRNPFLGTLSLKGAKDGFDFTEAKVGDNRLPFPLQVGRTGKLELVGRALTGDQSWRREYECKVLSYEPQTIAIGSFWIYKVECSIDGGRTGSEIYYYSPILKMSVLRISRKIKRNGRPEDKIIELREYMPAADQ